MFQHNGRNFDRDIFVFNPASNRVIRRAARTTKRILRDHHIEDVGGIPTLVEGNRVVDGHLTNPLTGRPVEVGGRVYRNLIRAGWFHVGDGGLVQGEFVGRLVLGEVPDGPDEIQIRLGRMIREFRLAHPGVPFYVAIPGAAGRMVLLQKKPKVANILGAIRRLLQQEDYENNLDDEFNLMAVQPQYNPLAGYELVVPLNVAARAQFVAASSFDGLCVRNCLQAALPDRDLSGVPDCCGAEDMTVIANTQRLEINIFTVNDLKTPLHQFRPGDNTGIKIVNLLYQFHHCILLPKGLRFADDKAPVRWYVDRQALGVAMLDCARTDPVRAVAGGKEEALLYGFSTPTAHYKLRFPGCDTQPKAWTETGAAFHTFKDFNGEPVIQERLKPFRADIVNRGLMYTKGVTGTVYLYDQRRAYASYAQCPFYVGFPTVNGPAELCAWDPAILDQAEGLALVHTELEYPATAFETQKLWAPFPQIRYALSRGEEFRVDMAIVLERMGDPFADTRVVFGEEKKEWFHQLIGRFFMNRVNPMAIATSADEVEELVNQGYHPQRAIQVGEQSAWLCTSRESIEKVPKFPYHAAYVHGYQKVTMHHDLISRLPEVGLDWGNVTRIWVDGVSLNVPLPEDFLPEERWKPEERRYALEQGWTMPIENLEPPHVVPEQLPAFDPLLIAPRVAVLGPPGSGKTHRVREFWSAEGRSLCLTASTHLAALQVGGDRAMTIHRAIVMSQRSPNSFQQDVLGGCDRLVVDEFTLMPKSMLETVLSWNVPVLFCGDFEQLCSLHGAPDREWLEDQGFRIEELTEIHRAANPRTMGLYRACRGKQTREIIAECQNAGVPVLEKLADLPYPALNERAHFVASRNDVVKAVNKEYARRLAGPNPHNVAWGSGERAMKTAITVGMLVIGIKTNKGFRNQEIGFVSKVGNRGACSVVSCATQRETVTTVKALNPGFALTFHRCQGQTFDFPLYVDTRRVFHRSMLYVAATRVRDAQHLTLIGAPRDWRRYDRETKKAELDAHQAQIEELIAEEEPEE